MDAKDLAKHPVHLGLGASAEIEPEFTGSMDWYSDYVDRHSNDGREGRLVSMHTFSQPWDMWEMHPQGSEVVICISGSMTLHQENEEGSRTSIDLDAGQYAINEPGIWHTADVDGDTTAVFITAGLGTEHRQR